jgi:YVTN family beta-propeller protein
MKRTAPFPGYVLLVTAGLIVLSAATSAPGQPGDGPLPIEAPPNDDAASPKHIPRPLPGMQDTGRILLPNQWSLKPVGRHVVVGDFPVNIALHPQGNFAALLHCGFGDHEIVVVDLRRLVIVSRAVLDQAFYGLCFDPAGEQLFASGGEDEVVYRFKFGEGYLSDKRTLRVGAPSDTFIPTGITCSPDGKTLYVANAWGSTLCILPADNDQGRTHISLGRDSYPYASLLSKDGQRLYVSLWGQAEVAVLDLERLTILGRWKTDHHPTEMALSPQGDVLYVACANSNSVTVIDTESGRAIEVISTALYPRARPGSTPNSIALTPDGRALLIANADNNNLAVFGIVERGKSRPLGHIPVGWYPTSVRFNPLDNRILVANGKGLLPKANRQGPNPNKERPPRLEEYIGRLFQGTLGVIDAPSPADMARYSELARACSPLREDEAPSSQPRQPDNPIPAKVGDKSPIKYCIYIVKENRTYDQVFGDMPQGNGDPSLCIFPEEVTPNHHALAREFVLLDNFYVESEVSADGHEWSMAAYATDFVEKSWPLNYRPGVHDKIKYPSEGSYAIAASSGGYIWDRCAAAGVSYRSYGEFIDNGPNPGDPGKASVKALEGHFDPLFRSYDLDYPDVKRAERFIEELNRFEREGELPQFIVMRLPNDHTHGTVPGKPTPTAMVADNDLALGMVVEAISRSRFWKETAIFVVEDDAQNGSDHVDAHRTVALVISPYVRRGSVDSNMYSTSSMLRTMELILGLQPMSQFDAAARPMYDSFRAQPDLTPYKLRPVQVDLAAKNRPDAWGAELSLKLDFSKEDVADDLLLNEVVWRSVRGPNSPMPPPVRASFVFPHGDDEEDAENEDDDEPAKVPPRPRRE